MKTIEAIVAIVAMVAKEEIVVGPKAPPSNREAHNP
jgi:hypothetical protein